MQAPLLGLALAGALVLPSAATAATGLGPPAELYKGSLLMQAPAVAMDGTSRAVVVWLDFGANAQQLLSRTYDGGRWSSVEPLPRGLGNPGDYRVVADRAGTVTVTWKASTNGVNRIESVRRHGSGPWSEPELVAPGPVNGYDLAAAPDGTVTVAWSQGTERALRVKSRSAGGAWPAVADAPGDRNAIDPDVAVDANAAGAVAVLYGRDGGDVEVAEGDGAGSWATTRLATSQTGVDLPKLALGDGGDAVAVWERDLAPDMSGISAAHRVAGRSWGATSPLTAPDASPAYPGAAVTADGRAFALWRDGKDKAIKTVRRGRGDGEWSDPETVGGAGASVGVLADDGRHAHVNLIDSTAGGSPRWGMSSGGPFEALHRADPDQTGMQASMAFDRQGNGMLAWLRLGRTASGEVSGFDVVARAIDGTPPEITRVVTPSRLAAGEAGAFAVEGADKFSSGTAAWDFGDGRAVAGASAGHAYAAPGVYQGRVMLADQHGNAVTRAFTVEVVPPSPGGTPGPPVTGGEDRRRPRVTVMGLRSRVTASWLLRRPRLRLTVDESSAIAVRIRAGGRTIAAGDTAGRRALRVRVSPTRAGRARLRRLRGPLRVTLTVTARDLAGNRRTVTRRMIVRGG